VIELLESDGVSVSQRSVNPTELLMAREMFNTGNFGKVMPCTRYESHEMPIGEVATLARKLYMEFMEAS
jgi:branched-chain amino acid aminotransferase